MLKRYVGDKAFYRLVIAVALPIMLQNGITNFVSMLDNIMVGRLDITQMNGAAITNQLIFIFNLCIFGAVAGAGIFSTQFYGKGDWDSIRHVFRFKLLLAFGLTAAAVAIFLTCHTPLISLYIEAGEDPAAIAATAAAAKKYLFVMLIGLLPFALTQCFSGTLRECGETVLPMQAGIIAVCVNLLFNWLLIFGNLGFPALGVAGAATATVISRFVELCIVVAWTVRHREQFPFIKKAFRSLYIPLCLVGRVSAKGVPLMCNEAFWALSVAFLNQCYATRGLAAVAAANITQSFNNLFSVSYQAVGIAVGIILGQLLGAGEFKKVKEDYPRLLAFAVVASLAMAALFGGLSGVIPVLYNTPAAVKVLTTQLIIITACGIPLQAYAFSSYFAIRSGGNMLVTILMDCGVTYVCVMPVIFLLSRYTSVSVLWLCIAYEGLNSIKCFLGAWLLKRGHWMQNIVS